MLALRKALFIGRRMKAKKTIDTRTEPQTRLPEYEVMLTDLTRCPVLLFRKNRSVLNGSNLFIFNAHVRYLIASTSVNEDTYKCCSNF